MFKTFALMDSVEVTGLLSEMNGGYSRYIRTSTSNKEFETAFYNASMFLATVSGLKVVPSSRMLARFNRLWDIVKKFETCELPANFFDGAIWRNYFQRTLSPSDRDLIVRQQFRFTNLNSQVINSRLALPFFNPPQLNTRGFDFFITSDPRPVKLSTGTKLLVRYHDPIPLSQPDTMDNSDSVNMHFQAVERTRRIGWFVCNSKATEREILDIFPTLSGRTYTIPYALPEASTAKISGIKIADIIRARLSSACVDNEGHKAGIMKDVLERANPDKPFKYIMWLTSIEPKKNTIGVIRAWEEVRYRHGDGLKLILVGKPAWRYKEILKAIKPRYLDGELLHLEDLPFVEIQTLYQNAECFVFPSFAEGFGFPPMEALSLGTPSVVSDIPAHRWVMGDSVLYADPYSDVSIANQIERLVYGEERQQLKATLVKNGRDILERYSVRTVSNQWSDLLNELRQRGEGSTI
ncbi:glycosyltransferase family 4 protein [Asticcacaulis benevestitus]|uniref:Glycosyl transferase family 1 domain-containing protein n=1 Tax=Asticcacaulis benevestitus DSM 16100 = ATCC BAA-896 TaxID=1121022 RepID=V4RIJ2_9CAUL|nr:glycosyltransferase family 1 protein [Asticcacaulis benevestitus]ESQ91133.1 hypothetical protein ABENE_10775 [Asticcacaulis benevestitus DSM 16100 = ATCC BAA-896]